MKRWIGHARSFAAVVQYEGRCGREFGARPRRPGGRSNETAAPAGDGAQLVTLSGVSKSFGDNLVLDGIDLEIGRGSAVVVAGPSGSGRLRCCAASTASSPSTRARSASTGARRGHQQEIYGIRARIGMVFQQFNLFPHMTVTENITLGPLELAPLRERPHARSAGAARARGHPGQGRRISRRPCRAASSNAWRSPAPSPIGEADAVRRADVGARPR